MKHFILDKSNHLIDLDKVSMVEYRSNKHDFKLTLKDDKDVYVESLPWTTSYFNSLVTL